MHSSDAITEGAVEGQSNDLVSLARAASFDDLFGGNTMKASALGNCGKYRIQIGPHNRNSTYLLGNPTGPSSSSIEIIMDNASGITIQYVDNDIVIVQTGDIGQNLEAGPFMYFSTVETVSYRSLFPQPSNSAPLPAPHMPSRHRVPSVPYLFSSASEMLLRVVLPPSPTFTTRPSVRPLVSAIRK